MSELDHTSVWDPQENPGHRPKDRYFATPRHQLFQSPTTSEGEEKSASSGIRPREENSNSREVRKTAQESYLAVATTWHDTGSTFFADHGRSSRIDHIVVRQAALGLVRSCRTLPIVGRRLQPFRTRERREHITVAIEIEVPLRCRPYTDARIAEEEAALADWLEAQTTLADLAAQSLLLEEER